MPLKTQSPKIQSIWLLFRLGLEAACCLNSMLMSCKNA